MLTGTLADALLDVVLPLECGGCGAPQTRWCTACAADLKVHTDEPGVISPRIDPGVPVFALGRYAGARRRAIVALKEHGRRDLVAPLAVALADGEASTLGGLMVTAPARTASARSRWQASASVNTANAAATTAAAVTSPQTAASMNCPAPIAAPPVS